MLGKVVAIRTPYVGTYVVGLSSAPSSRQDPMTVTLGNIERTVRCLGVYTVDTGY